jgi:hypothetical protein
MNVGLVDIAAARELRIAGAVGMCMHLHTR